MARAPALEASIGGKLIRGGLPGQPAVIANTPANTSPQPIVIR
jgi:hypothetical protein